MPPSVSRAVFAASGHLPFIDDRAEFLSDLLDFYDGGYGLVVMKVALDEEGCTCEFRLKGPVAASTGVGDRLLEPVLALPEAPVNFEDLSFVDHPPTAATLLLLADEPVSEDEDF